MVFKALLLVILRASCSCTFWSSVRYSGVLSARSFYLSQFEVGFCHECVAKSSVYYNIGHKGRRRRSNICIIGVPSKESRTNEQKKYTHIYMHILSIYLHMFRRKNLQRRRKVMICRPKGQTVPGEVETGINAQQARISEARCFTVKKGALQPPGRKSQLPLGDDQTGLRYLRNSLAVACA